MNDFLEANSLENLPNLHGKPVHLCIGIFDGIHLGHQAILNLAINSAKANGALAALLTFEPHPSHVLAPEHAVPMLMSPSSKKSFIRNLGINLYIEHPFTLEFAQIEATDFLPLLVKHIPNLSHIYIGENFKFGHHRKGDVSLLQQQAPSFNITIEPLPRVQHDGAPISSSRIRKLLASGQTQQAHQLLGHHEL